MQNSFGELMAQKTDEQLILIVNAADGDYQKLAVEAAQNELSKRNISQEIISQITIKQDQEKISVDEKANEPLQGFFKLILLLFVFPLAGFIVKMIAAMVLEKRGYTKKANDVITWTALGIAVYIVLFGTIMVFVKMIN